MSAHEYRSPRQVPVLRNDFGVVRVEIEDGPTKGLRLTDMRTGRSTLLDPLELECLVWAGHEDLDALLNPSTTRWRSDAENERPTG